MIEREITADMLESVLQVAMETGDRELCFRIASAVDLARNKNTKMDNYPNFEKSERSFKLAPAD